jgi:hypothetical protein
MSGFLRVYNGTQHCFSLHCGNSPKVFSLQSAHLAQSFAKPARIFWLGHDVILGKVMRDIHIFQ